VPADPTQSQEAAAADEAQPPYYILAARPGEQDATFQLTSALNAFRRQNLSAFVSASSDPETYGQIQVLRLPGNTPFRGPQQVQQAFNTNDEVARDLTLFNSEDSQAVFGNLLTLPIGANGLLYVQPLYVEGTGENSFPLLRKVLVNYGGRVGYADTLSEALDEVFGAGAGDTATDSDDAGTTPDEQEPPTPATPPADPSAPADPATPPADGGTPAPEVDEALRAVDAALQALENAQRNGDFAAQGQALTDLQRAVEAYEAATGAAGAAATPTG